jgi:hypothetical protein
MLELNLPKATIRMENKDGKPSIWDAFRKKWLVLTPEEYVRQHFLHYLCAELQYPASLVSVERGLDVNILAKRTDIVVFGRNRQPHILIECKAPQVKISQQTLEQASVYNLKLKAPFLAVTNGIEHHYFRIHFETNSFQSIPLLPTYN